jgi:hypothetical protein
VYVPDPSFPPLHAEGTVPTGPLPAGATAALRSWLQAQHRAHATAADVHTADVRRALRPVCAEAHRRGVRVEEVIVLLKELWATLPPDPDRDGFRDARREVLDTIVSTCIEEYYASPTVASPTVARRADGALADEPRVSV